MRVPGNAGLLVLPATVTDPPAPQALDLWFDHLIDRLLAAVR